jgi:hypothetical protein
MFKLILNAIQPFYKQDGYILIDNDNPQAQPIDCLTLARYLKSKGDKVCYLINEKNKLVNELKKEFGKDLITYKKPRPILRKIFFRLITAKYVIESFHNLSYRNYKNLSKRTQLVFAQHGVNFFKGIDHVPLNKDNYNKIIISSPSEEKLFLNKGFKDKDFITAGLPRWDLLSEKKEKGIFIYFTFRDSLRDVDITKTVYYKRLLNLTQKLSMDFPNTPLFIGLHHELSKVIKELPNIKIVDENDIDKVKNKTSLLITDFSSMCFEYLVMNKPVVFYRLDDDDSNLDEHDKNISKNASLKDDTIFNVFYNETETIAKIKFYIDNGFKLEKENIKKLDNFFYCRKDICKIIYKQLRSK